uniref:Peroxisomal membrane protein 4-like n=1 Tax=Ciona intestinalis TaxID=7719 RepID=F6ZS91_CIOIN|nr:peroxisomal membrane protein 4-like [Ciona intestinalis]|eukprot:XP_002126961.1 peroxisomal membrane protein 4-like [Ciona intestinalis]
MSSLLQIINQTLQSGNHQQILSLLKGIRNGIVYGVKIRFPHALVMTFLFKDVPLKDKIRLILRATYQHARNLAQFTFLYKLLTTTLSKTSSKPSVGKNPLHVIPAAAFAGYLVFGEKNPINMQINMYLLSRIIFGLCRVATERGYFPSEEKLNGVKIFPVFAATMWGVVLWLFENHKHTLQPSLQASMTYLYHDSNKWNNIWDFLVYNKLP